MVASKVRLGGSGYTVLSWRGTTLAYLRNLEDTPPRPVAQIEAIQPIDAETPLEIVTPMAVGAGQLRLQFYELWNEPVWARLPGLEGTRNLLEVFKRQLSLGEITCRKIIKNPNGAYRVRVYHGIVIADIDEGERVQIETMSLPKTITLQYTHTSTI